MADFTFYSSYNLTSAWSELTWTNIGNRILAVILLSECVADSCKLFHVALRYSKANPLRSSLSDLLRLEDGLCEQDFVHIGVRLINWTFHLKLTLMLAIIASGQIPAGLCLCILLIFSLITSIHFFRMICKYGVYKSKVTATYRIFLETSLLFFFAICLIERMSFLSSHKREIQKLVTYIEGIVLFCMSLCILLQLVTNFLDIWRLVLSKRCKKKEISIEDLRNRLTETKFASVYQETLELIRQQEKSIKKSSVFPQIKPEGEKRKVKLKQLVDKKNDSTEELPQSSRLLLSKRDEGLTLTPVSKRFTPKEDCVMTEAKEVHTESTKLRSNPSLPGVDNNSNTLPSVAKFRFHNPVLAALRHKSEQASDNMHKTPKKKIKITGFHKAPKASLPSVELFVDSGASFPFSTPRLDRKNKVALQNTSMAGRKDQTPLLSHPLEKNVDAKATRKPKRDS